jgi:hypothetical protein
MFLRDFSMINIVCKPLKDVDNNHAHCFFLFSESVDLAAVVIRVA